MSDEALKQHFREATRLPGRGDCLGREELVAAGEGGLDEARRLHFARHLATCPDCALEYRLARELHQGALALAEPGRQAPAALPAAPPAPPFWLRWYAWAPAAAAIALAVALPLTLRTDPEPPRAILRGQPASPIRSAVPGNRVVPRSRFILRWSGPRGARYSVKVALPDLTVLARSRGLVRRRFQVTAAALAKVPRGTRVLWSVTAVLHDGSRIASPLFGVRVE